MKPFLVLVFALASASACATQVSAPQQQPQASFGALNHSSPCTVYYNMRKGTSVDTVKVAVLDDNGRGLVKVLVLGLPKRVLVTVNGIDVRKRQVQREPVVCSGATVGSILTFDLSAMPITAGYFQVQAGRFMDGRSITIQP